MPPSTARGATPPRTFRACPGPGGLSACPGAARALRLPSWPACARPSPPSAPAGSSPSDASGSRSSVVWPECPPCARKKRQLARRQATRPVGSLGRPQESRARSRPPRRTASRHRQPASAPADLRRRRAGKGQRRESRQAGQGVESAQAVDARCATRALGSRRTRGSPRAPADCARRRRAGVACDRPGAACPRESMPVTAAARPAARYWYWM